MGLVVPKKGKLFPLKFDDNLVICEEDHRILFFLSGPKLSQIWMQFLPLEDRLEYLSACKFWLAAKSKVAYYQLLSRYILPEIAKNLDQDVSMINLATER